MHFNPKKKKKKRFIITSGGTTGEPIKIVHDINFNLKCEAAVKAFQEISDYHYGDNFIYLWGDERLIFQENRNKYKLFINTYLRNTRFQNAFRMSDRVLMKYIQEINEYKPKVIYTYVQSINEMAKFIKRHNLKISPINSIIVSAGVLTEDMRIFIEKIFKTKVYNLYGSRYHVIIAINCILI